MEILPINNPTIDRASAMDKRKNKNFLLEEKSKPNRSDKVSISSESSDKLERVKARLNAGFYFSSEVKSDLSEKLTNILDQMTD